ncbi:hypothetical protein AK830_g5082 [Neonectria ditissima]|uniref:Carboxylic ester hydrolase n=1 Tax=Neonectria ditissima TaxID=78410 RepID=A0A0P7BLZ3_9HYPO|nr:hypothetical protein AK830_g5082 [Neonectria ditissima]
MKLAYQVRALALLSLVLGITASYLPHHSPPKAKLLNGTYKGIYNNKYRQDLFLGIPYAQPPVGSLRLRVPQSLNTTWTGTRVATEYSPQCIGYGSDTWVLGNYVSEDCLTINVVRPAGISSKAKLPVALWIHGGGFTNGGGSDPRYNLSFIVEQSVKMGTPMVAASINYRLQNWGFLYSEDLAAEGSTNLGFRDQRLAMHWVKENIAAFGGDPAHITLWGESAGARSVGAQLVAYGGRDDDLFHAAILQSGSPLPGTFKPQTAKSWKPYYDALLVATNCSSAAHSVACLRRVPTDKLSAVFNSSFATAPGYGQVVDGDFLVAPGDALLRQAKFVKVPLLTGTNFDEGTLYATKGINTSSEFAAMVKSGGVNDSAVTDIMRLYPDDPTVGLPATLQGRPEGPLARYGLQWKRAVAYRGDTAQHAARRLVTRSWASSGVPVWSYHWNVIVKGISPADGVTHFQEVVFVFNNVDGQGYDTAVSTNPLAGKPKKFIELADTMSKSWVSFITKSNPNYRGQRVKWPEYKVEKPQNLVYDVNVTRLGYVEPDKYRQKGISYIIDNLYS